MSDTPGRKRFKVIVWVLARWRQITVGGVSATLAAFGAAVVTNFEDTATTTCTIAAAQPALSDACGALGLGHQPTRKERLYWQARRPGSCEDVRRYVDLTGKGEYRGAYLAEATALLAAKRVTTTGRFVPGRRMLALYVMGADTAAENEAASHAKALAQAEEQAGRDCRAFAQTTLFQFQSAGVEAQRWRCEPSGGGVACSLEGQTVCHLQERQPFETETCGR